MPKLSEVTEFTILRPDDWHCHFRQGEMAEVTLAELSRYYHRVLGMPNIKGRPIAKREDLDWYKAEMDQICERLGLKLRPYYMLMLQDETSYREVEVARQLFGCLIAFKCYLQGTTTNSGDGVSDLWSPRFHEIFYLMQDHQIPLSIHLEEPGSYDELAEAEALWRLEQLHERYPRLKIVMEHVSTMAGVELIKKMPDNIVGTLAIQHVLLLTEDARRNPHLLCKPIAKTPHDREAVIQAALSGSRKFFMGNDTAGHSRELKEQADESKRPSGIWNASTAFPLWVDLFEQRGATTEQLQFFVSEAGAQFYHLRRGDDRMLHMAKRSWIVPGSYGDNLVVPLWAGKEISWQAV